MITFFRTSTQALVYPNLYFKYKNFISLITHTEQMLFLILRNITPCTLKTSATSHFQKEEEEEGNDK